MVLGLMGINSILAMPHVETRGLKMKKKVNKDV